MTNGIIVWNTILAMEMKKSANIYLFFLPFVGIERSDLEVFGIKQCYTSLSRSSGGSLQGEGLVFTPVTNFHPDIFGTAFVNSAAVEPEYDEKRDVYVYEHRIPAGLYHSVLNGNYSEIEDAHKEIILDYWGITGKEDILYYILNPMSHFESIGYTPKRKIEIWPKPALEEITLNV